ncbi:RNA-binding domain superfamily [Sesbania bispinosa]|nr:RNA-binding domain superfamily [Sesbania bispinosa]
MAALHTSLLLQPNFLSLTTPSTHTASNLRLTTTHLQPLLKLVPSLTVGTPTTTRRSRAVAEQATVTSSDPKSEAARRLYVGNIPRTVTNDELARIVEEHGAVEKAEVMYDKYSGRSRRFAFVTMKTVEDANAAIEKLNGTQIGGREIKVNITEKPLSTVDLSILQVQAEESEYVDGPHKVYVGNLAKTVTTDTLKNFFSEKGKVLSAKVPQNPVDEDVEAATSSFNNALLEGQEIRVNKA